MPDMPIPVKQAIEFAKSEQWQKLRTLLAEMPPPDIADILKSLDHNSVSAIFRLLPPETKPEVLAEIEGSISDELIESLSNAELSDLVEEMAPDDAADLLAELSDKRTEHVLNLMDDPESANDVRGLLSYPEDSAGGIMNSDVVAMNADQTVEEALDAIADLDASERFFIANIVDANGILIGTADVWMLLREHNRQRRIGEIADTRFHAAAIDMDQEEVAQLMAKYDLDVIPVVDLQGHLVGRVTSDDIIDVIQEEASEDLFRLAGSDDQELELSSVFTSCRIRLPWLLITLFGGMINAVIFNTYRTHLETASLLVLIGFVPTVLAMGGNTGIQSSILVVRSLAIKAEPTRGIVRLIVHELGTGAVMGVACGILIGSISLVVINSQFEPTGLVSAFHLGSVVAVSLFAAMTFAATFGTLVPVFLNKIKVDPAVASGPFITIVNDITALLIYFMFTAIMLNILTP